MAALVLLLLSCVACARGPMPPDEPVPSGPTPLSTASEEVIELRVGATAPIAGTTSTIGFTRVVTDSRCPKGVTCVWEGDAVVELRVHPREGETRLVELHSNERFERQARIEGVTLTLERLEPQPDAEGPASADRYVVTLRIGAP
jgi:hypothetical protein